MSAGAQRPSRAGGEVGAGAPRRSRAARPFVVDVCASCGLALFPPRPVCPSCAGREWERCVADRGVVEQRTWRFHRTREERRIPVRQWWDLQRVPIAFVRLSAGPVVVAWSPEDAAVGAVVQLESDSGVPVAWLDDGVADAAADAAA